MIYQFFLLKIICSGFSLCEDSAIPHLVMSCSATLAVHRAGLWTLSLAGPSTCLALLLPPAAQPCSLRDLTLVGCCDGPLGLACVLLVDSPLARARLPLLGCVLLPVHASTFVSPGAPPLDCPAWCSSGPKPSAALEALLQVLLDRPGSGLLSYLVVLRGGSCCVARLATTAWAQCRSSACRAVRLWAPPGTQAWGSGV